jgi:hypothetical protein
MLSQVVMLLTCVQDKASIDLSQGTEYPDRGLFFVVLANSCK